MTISAEAGQVTCRYRYCTILGLSRFGRYTEAITHSVTDVAVLFARRHSHSVHSLVLRAFWCIPSLEDFLLICQVVHFHS